MRWITPKYSKSKVRKAGKSLLATLSDKNWTDDKYAEFNDALEVLSNWRASHAYPMHTVLITLRRRAKKVDKNAVVVQRLKRTPSIVAKMLRFSSMGLERMQDIAGCRAVVSNIRKANILSDKILSSKISHTFHGSKDYITNPKESGYRGIHLIYKYNASKVEYRNLFIEIQIRSAIQHSWATAVEVVGAFTKQALKSNYGDQKWKDFFRYVSVEFARLEKCSIIEGLEGIDCVAKIKELLKELDVINKLNAFAVSSQLIGGEKGDFYILILDTEAKNIKYKIYEKANIEMATNEYLNIEKETKDDPSKDVVLVSADSIKGLKRAYPNYFADTRAFVKTMLKVIG